MDDDAHEHRWELNVDAHGGFISYDMNPPLYDWRCACGATKRDHDPRDLPAAPHPEKAE